AYLWAVSAPHLAPPLRRARFAPPRGAPALLRPPPYIMPRLRRPPIAVAADTRVRRRTIARAALEPGTAASRAGPSRTVSASRTADIRRFSIRCPFEARYVCSG